MKYQKKRKKRKKKRTKRKKWKLIQMKNEYVLLVSKRVRAYRKKLSKIEEIEKKVKEGAKINEDQKKVLESKEGTFRALKDFEELRVSLMKVQSQEEKSAPQGHVASSGVSVNMQQGLKTIISVVQFSQLTNDHNVRNQIMHNKVKETDLERVNRLANALCSPKSNSLKDSVDQAHQLAEKLAKHSDEHFDGVPFAQIAKQVEELVSVVSLKKEEPAPIVESSSVSPDVSQPEKKNEPIDEAPNVSQPDATGEEETAEGIEDEFISADRSRGRGYRNGRGGRRGRGRGGYANEEGNWESPQRNRRQGPNKRYHERRGGERSERGGSPRTHRPQNEQNE